MARRQDGLPTAANIDIDSRLFNKVYLPHMNSVHNYEVYYGGAASGKSTFIGQKLAIQMTIMPGRNCVVLRKQKKDCIKSCWGEIYNSLGKFHLRRFWDIQRNPDHIMTNRYNGNVILFEGLDDVEDIKSIKFTNDNPDIPGDKNITDIWYEEANAEKDIRVIRQLDIRVRDPYLKGRLILSFNPISRTHILYDFVMRELKTGNKDAMILKTTYKDNKWCKQETIDKYEDFKYTDPYYYKVYALGEWGTMGETVFDANKISARLTRLQDMHSINPPVRVNFSYETDDKDLPIIETVKEQVSMAGETTIYVQPNPKHPYVAALDTAGEGEDYYFLHIFDNITDEQVATFRSDRLADHCMLQVYGLLKMYNNALFAPEVNFSDYPILKMKEWKYMNIYQREKPKTSRSDGYEQKLGFRTTSGNRQSMLDNLIDWLKTNYDKINDPVTLNEMLTFTRQTIKNKGIFMGAEEGEHDDSIISLAIMLQAKEQQVCYEIPEMQHIEGYWTLGELNLALADNRVSLDAVREYKEIYSHRFERKERRVNRYAR